jgi:hypothetical protein
LKKNRIGKNSYTDINKVGHMQFRSLLVISLLLSSLIFAGVQTIPIDEDVAAFIGKKMAVVKPSKVISKYDYRSASKTKDLITVISEQKKEIKILQKDLLASTFEMRKLEARLQVLENRIQRNYSYVEFK